MWPAPSHRPQQPAAQSRLESAVDQNGDIRVWALPSLGGDCEGWLINRQALIALPPEPVCCPGFDCNRQALIHFPMCWVCPTCHSRFPVRKSLLTL